MEGRRAAGVGTGGGRGGGRAEEGSMREINGERERERGKDREREREEIGRGERGRERERERVLQMPLSYMCTPASNSVPELQTAPLSVPSEKLLNNNTHSNNNTDTNHITTNSNTTNNNDNHHNRNTKAWTRIRSHYHWPYLKLTRCSPWRGRRYAAIITSLA